MATQGTYCYRSLLISGLSWGSQPHRRPNGGGTGSKGVMQVPEDEASYLPRGTWGSGFGGL